MESRKDIFLSRATLQLASRQRLTNLIDKGVISISPRTRTRGSWPQRANLFTLGRHVFDAKVHGERDFSSWLAAIERDTRKSCRKTYSDLFLRSVLPCPRRHGSGIESMGSKIRQSTNLCLDCGVGGPDYRRVAGERNVVRDKRAVGRKTPILSK